MKKAFLLIVSSVSAIAIAACEEDIGGPCRTVQYPGSAVIVSVEEDTSRFRTCENSVVILFDFEPTDANALSRYHHPSWPDTNQIFIVGGGGSAPSNWALSQGLVVGSEHSCVRWETITGTCSPVGFRFPDIDFSAWGDSCETR